MTTRSRRQLYFEKTSPDTNERGAEHSSDICALCKVHRKCMSHVETWRNAQACDFVANIGITPDNLVCHPCRDDVRRVLANPSHVPRWEKKSKHNKCCVRGCSELHFVSSRVTDPEKLNEIFTENSLQTEGDIPVPTPLCKQHYYTVYNMVQPQLTNCPRCGISLSM